MRIVIGFCLSLALSAQTFTLKTAVAAKPDALTFTVPNITIEAGNSIVAIIGYGPVGITSVSWNGILLGASAGAGNFGKGGRNYTSGARTLTYSAQNVGGTGDLTFAFTREAYEVVVAVFESSIRGTDAGVGAPVGGWADPTSNPETGPLPYQTTQTEFLIAALSTEGPVTDAPGVWASGWIDCGRWGTVGGGATANITLSLGCRTVTDFGSYNVSKTGVTARYWALSLGSFIP